MQVQDMAKDHGLSPGLKSHVILAGARLVEGLSYRRRPRRDPVVAFTSSDARYASTSS